MRHRILALLLALVLVFTLSACGGKAGPTGDASPELSSPAQGGGGPSADENNPSGEPSAEPAEEPSYTPPQGRPTPSATPSQDPSASSSPSAKPSAAPSVSPAPSISPAPSPSQSGGSGSSPSQAPAPSTSVTPSPIDPSDAPSVPATPSDAPPIIVTDPVAPPSPSVDPSVSQPPAPSVDPSPSPSQGAAAPGDLNGFYAGLFDKYENFNATMPVEGEFLAAYYAALSDISLKQQLIYMPKMSAVACEIALVEVENAADVQKVKDIFQARIDYQTGANGGAPGACYPATVESWEANSRVVVNGNRVMLIVGDYCDDIAADFNALP